MNILLIGSGAREHAIATALMRSSEEVRLYNVGSHVNPGLKHIAFDIKVMSLKEIDAIIEYAKAKAIDLVVVGPEEPLALGLVDACNEAGIDAIGPRRISAQLETSKGFTR